MEWNRRIRFVLFSYTGTDIVSLFGVMEKKKKEKLLHKQRKIFTGNKTLTSIERLIHADFIYIIGRIKQDKTMDGKTRESNTLMKILRSI